MPPLGSTQPGGNPLGNVASIVGAGGATVTGQSTQTQILRDILAELRKNTTNNAPRGGGSTQKCQEEKDKEKSAKEWNKAFRDAITQVKDQLKTLVKQSAFASIPGGRDSLDKIRDVALSGVGVLFAPAIALAGAGMLTLGQLLQQLMIPGMKAMVDILPTATRKGDELQRGG